MMYGVTRSRSSHADHGLRHLRLNVDDPDRLGQRSPAEHFGFQEQMAPPTASCRFRRPDAGFNLVYLRTGLSTFK